MQSQLRHRYRSLIAAVWRANLDLHAAGLVVGTWGNVSAIDRAAGLVAIKPSGVDYAALRPADIVLTGLDGRPVASNLRPSSDLPSHLELYRAFAAVGSVAHSHSMFATAWAQARRPLPCLGTTHADYFHGPVPVTAPLTPRQIRGAYEAQTGAMIARRFRQLRLDPRECPAALVASHGPFAWGATAAQAVENAVVLEAVSKLAWLTLALDRRAPPLADGLLEKHYRRKHGPGAYYGQRATGRRPAGRGLGAAP